MAAFRDDGEPRAGDRDGHHLLVWRERRQRILAAAHDEGRHGIARYLPAPVWPRHDRGLLAQECFRTNCFGHFFLIRSVRSVSASRSAWTNTGSSRSVTPRNPPRPHISISARRRSICSCVSATALVAPDASPARAPSPHARTRDITAHRQAGERESRRCGVRHGVGHAVDRVGAGDVGNADVGDIRELSLLMRPQSGVAQQAGTRIRAGFSLTQTPFSWLKIAGRR